VDLETDALDRPLAEQALIALGQAVADGRVKVDASGVTIEADVIDVDIEALISGIAGDPGKTLADLAALLGDPAQAGESGAAADALLAYFGDEFADGALWEGAISAVGWLSAISFYSYDNWEELDAIRSGLGSAEADGSLWFYGMSAAEWLAVTNADLWDLLGNLGDEWTDGALWQGGLSVAYCADQLMTILDYLTPRIEGVWEILNDLWDQDRHALRTDGHVPGSFAGGTKTVAAAATPEALVASSTPCRFVWVGARVNGDGAAQNTKPVFLGDSAGQNIPVMPNDFEGVTVPMDDAQKVYVKVGVNGEGVAYRVFA
jgi:hypothetical protein